MNENKVLKYEKKLKSLDNNDIKTNIFRNRKTKEKMKGTKIILISLLILASLLFIFGIMLNILVSKMGTETLTMGTTRGFVGGFIDSIFKPIANVAGDIVGYLFSFVIALLWAFLVIPILFILDGITVFMNFFITGELLTSFLFESDETGILVRQFEILLIVGAAIFVCSLVYTTIRIMTDEDNRVKGMFVNILKSCIYISFFPMMFIALNFVVNVIAMWLWSAVGGENSMRLSAVIFGSSFSDGFHEVVTVPEEAFFDGWQQFQFLVFLIASIMTVIALLLMIYNIIVRSYEIVALYLIAPIPIATQVLDNGEKMSQWFKVVLGKFFQIFTFVLMYSIFLATLPIIVTITASFEGKTYTGIEVENYIGILNIILICCGAFACTQLPASMVGIFGLSSVAAGMSAGKRIFRKATKALSGPAGKVAGGAASLVRRSKLGGLQDKMREKKANLGNRFQHGILGKSKNPNKKKGDGVLSKMANSKISTKFKKGASKAVKTTGKVATSKAVSPVLNSAKKIWYGVVPKGDFPSQEEVSDIKDKFKKSNFNSDEKKDEKGKKESK